MSEPSAPQPVEQRPGPEDGPPKGALGIIFLIVFMDLMGFGIIIPLLPQLIPNYQERPIAVVLLFSVFSACQFIGAPILGTLSDRYGRRPVLIVSQVGSAVGYVLLALSTPVGMAVGMKMILLFASRVLDGFTGGNISTAQAYISDVTTPENRAKGMGVLGAAFGIGFSAGPAIGGLAGHFWLPLPALLAACFALLAAVLTWAKLPEPRRHVSTDAGHWLHPRRFAPVLRNSVLVQLMLISFLIMASFVMMESTVVLFLGRTGENGFGYGRLGVGWFFAWVGFVIVIVQGGLIGRLSKRVGDWPLAIAGSLLVAAGMALFTVTAFDALLALLLMAGATNAAGRSLQQPTMSALISKYSNPREQGVVFGLYHGLGSLARVIGPLIAGLAYPYVHNTGQFLVAGGIAIAMAGWTMLLRRTAGAPPGRGFEVVPTTAAATPEPT